MTLSDADIDAHLHRSRTNPGVWLVHSVDPYAGAGGVAAFRTELEALRYALSNDMRATYVPYGLTLDEAQDPAVQAAAAKPQCRGTSAPSEEAK